MKPYLADRYDVIGIEDISVKAMAKRKKGGKFSFGKSVADNGWNMFTNMLEYKLAWQGKQHQDRQVVSKQPAVPCLRISEPRNQGLIWREWDCPKSGEVTITIRTRPSIFEEARRISA